MLTAHLATRYLAPDYKVYHHFDPATVFPLRGTSKQGIVLFIAPDTYPVRDLARELYPGVVVETFGHAESERAVLHKYLFPREELTSVQGLDVRYAALDDPNRVEYRAEGTMDVNWGADGEGNAPPLPGPLLLPGPAGCWPPAMASTGYRSNCRASTLGARWTARTRGAGDYRPRDRVGSGHAYALPGCAGQRAGGGAPVLASARGRGAASCARRCALSRNLAGARPGGALLRQRDLGGRARAGAHRSPDRVLLSLFASDRPYTVEWTGQLNVPLTGPYRFRLHAISQATLFLDGELVFDSAVGPASPQPLQLSAGLHDVRIRFLDDRSHSQIYLYWEHPDGRSELVPSDALYLPAEGAWWPVP